MLIIYKTKHNPHEYKQQNISFTCCRKMQCNINSEFPILQRASNLLKKVPISDDLESVVMDDANDIF